MAPYFKGGGNLEPTPWHACGQFCGNKHLGPANRMRPPYRADVGRELESADWPAGDPDERGYGTETHFRKIRQN
ncbi:protein of unknown function [Kyrpidia spormannii]|uniref:Uncharacterized protein n=1 Tax=Kyrpidia spormannii TaxID=2055160 RepID=A0A6F9EBS4_9BACL|nr:protein of unknown function [Kyrpidia spormannii]